MFSILAHHTYVNDHELSPMTSLNHALKSIDFIYLLWETYSLRFDKSTCTPPGLLSKAFTTLIQYLPIMTFTFGNDLKIVFTRSEYDDQTDMQTDRWMN